MKEYPVKQSSIKKAKMQVIRKKVQNASDKKEQEEQTGVSSLSQPYTSASQPKN